MPVIILHSGNSLVNSIMYIFKMPIFRAVIRKFIRKWEVGKLFFLDQSSSAFSDFIFDWTEVPLLVLVVILISIALYYNESGYSSTGSDSVRTWCCAKYVKSFKRVRPKRLVAFFHSMLFNGQQYFVDLFTTYSVSCLIKGYKRSTSYCKRETFVIGEYKR